MPVPRMQWHWPSGQIVLSILERECIRLTDGDERPDTPEEDENSRTEPVSIISLEEALNKAIQEENYELAARLRDEINRHK